MKRIFINILFGTMFAIIVSMLAACSDDAGENEKEEQDKTVPVETAQVEKGTLTIHKSLFGRTAPSGTTPIMVENPGEVEELDVSDGDNVETDDVLATILSPAGEEELLAPEAGVVTQLEAEEGEVVSDEDPFAVITDMDDMTISFDTAASMLELLEAGETHKTFIQDETYQAEITKVAQMPGDNGMYPVKATVENEDDNILPGMIAEMHIPQKRVEDSIIIPTNAIVEEGGKSFVFVVGEDDTAKKTEVAVNDTQSDQSAVEGEINKGDVIVVKGQLRLVDDSKVTVTEAGNSS